MNKPLVVAGFIQLVLSLTFVSVVAGQDVVIENPRVRLTVSSDAVWKEITDKRRGKNYCPAGSAIPFAKVSIAKKSYDAQSIAKQGNEITIRFHNTPIIATCRIEPSTDWITVELLSVKGGDADSVEFLRVPVTITEKVGHRLNIAWNDEYAICVAACNMLTCCGTVSGKGYALLTVRAFTQFGFTGPKAAMLTCPTAEMKPLLHKLSVACGLLRNDKDGVPSKDLPMARQSYWFLGGITEENLDEVIAYGKKAGIKQVMISQGCWARTTGHYLFNEKNYPHGLAGLKQVVDKLHRAGFLVGMHTFVSKVSKNDPYVTPVPDKRFWKDLTARLAQDVDATQTEIRATETLADWPDSPLCKQKIWEGGVKRHMDAIIEDEIVQYEAIGPEGKCDTFLRCKRGAYGTRAAPHKAGTPIYHFGVDGCINGYIIDQETDLLDEVAARNAAIFNEAGFDMVYFDGGEDVPRPHWWHYSAKFQAAAVNRYVKRPLIHMGTVMTHLVWHSFTRSGTVDTYLNTLRGAIKAGATMHKWPTVKQHIDNSVRYMLRCEMDMLPGELGWFGIWPKDKDTDGLQLDEIEYLMVKSLAYNAPISLETNFRQMEAHPLTPAILDIVRTYEELRAAGNIDRDTRTKLKEMGKDFALIRHDGRSNFVEMTVVPTVGGGRDVRALVGQMGESAVATFWHYIREGEVRLTLNAKRVRLLDFAGTDVPFKQEHDTLILPAALHRYTLICDGVKSEELAKALKGAKVTTLPPIMIWIQAERFTRCGGKMALGSAVGLKDEGAIGDFVVCTGAPSPSDAREWFCEYTVEMPRKGTWSVWARLRYPTGGDMSFGFVPAGEPLTLAGEQILGNSGQNRGQWHWDGNGGGTASVPGQRVRRIKLDKGPFTFRVYAREGPGRVADNPRIDMLCLCDDPGYVPNDEEALQQVSGGQK